MNKVVQHQQQQRNRLLGCYSNIDNLQKGEITDRLSNGYGGEQLKFTKTGKQIKEKVPQIVSALTDAKNTIVAQLAVLKTQVGQDPTDSYNAKDLTLLRYSNKMCYAEWNEDSRSYGDTTDSMKFCQQYNELCWNLVDVTRDLKSIEVVGSNLEDGKKYELTVSQLVALQFN